MEGPISVRHSNTNRTIWYFNYPMTVVKPTSEQNAVFLLLLFKGGWVDELFLKITLLIGRFGWLYRVRVGSKCSSPSPPHLATTRLNVIPMSLCQPDGGRLGMQLPFFRLSTVPINHVKIPLKTIMILRNI